VEAPVRALLLVAALSIAGAPARAGDTITGVCPDGSVFIVKRSADIPCRDARQVEPQEVPPLKPQYLPRPYAWDVFQKQQDPNNPYNLVEAARRVREGAAPPDAGAPVAPGGGPAPPTAAAPPPVTAAVPPQAAAPQPPPEASAFSEQEIRDLFLIVELSQPRAPARFAPEPGLGVGLQLAHSPAFEARLAGRPAGAGPVVLFSALAEEPGAFHANLTFVQGHQAFQPDAKDSAQLGVLHGALGPLGPEEAVLGYVVLPGSMDPARPMDIYWNDRLIQATLEGAGADGS